MTQRRFQLATLSKVTLAGFASIVFAFILLSHRFSNGDGKKSYAQIEVEQAVEYIRTQDIKQRSSALKPVFKALRSEGSIWSLFLRNGSRDLFGLDNVGNELTGGYDEANDAFFGGNTSSWSPEQKASVRKWIGILKEHDLVGFGAREKSEYVEVYLRPNVRIISMWEGTSERFREFMNKHVSSGYDPRGDAYFKVDDNTVVATDRR